MGSGGKMSRRSSNFSESENDENVDAYFVDAREMPGSKTPISLNRKESAFNFWIWGLWAKIRQFCHFYASVNLKPNQENEKMAISQPRDHQSKK